MKNTRTSIRLGIALAVPVLAAGSLAGCSSSSDSSSSASSAAGCPVTVADPWVKAADKGMTAAFGTLTNTGSGEVVVTAANTPDSATTELHEVVDDNGKMVMQPVPGGFSVPAGGTLTLEPGGFHIMLMDVTKPIQAGQDVPFTLTCSDGATAEFTAQAREFEGGDEEYQNEGMDSMEGGMDMSSMTPTPGQS